MGFEEILLELRKLNRGDKLRAMQVLVTELAAEEQAWLIPGATYEIATPYGDEAAAQVLYEVLQAAKALKASGGLSGGVVSIQRAAAAEQIAAIDAIAKQVCGLG